MCAADGISTSIRRVPARTVLGSWSNTAQLDCPAAGWHGATCTNTLWLLHLHFRPSLVQSLIVLAILYARTNHGYVGWTDRSRASCHRPGLSYTGFRRPLFTTLYSGDCDAVSWIRRLGHCSCICRSSRSCRVDSDGILTHWQCFSITQVALVLTGRLAQSWSGRPMLTILRGSIWPRPTPKYTLREWLVESTKGMNCILCRFDMTAMYWRISKTLYKAIPVYLAGLTLTKLSILLQYMRLFQGKTIHRIIIGMLIFVAAYGKSILPFYRYTSIKDGALNKTKQEHGPSSAPYSSALPSTTFGIEKETPNAWSSKQNGSATQPWI